jgi:hypothetical protein
LVLAAWLALLLAPVGAALAQSTPEQPGPEAAEAAPGETATGEAATGEAATDEAATAEDGEADMAEIDASTLDWSQLNVDAFTLVYGKAPRAQGPTQSAGATWSNKDRPNGASAVSVKQSLTPFWDTRIGADMTVTREPATMSELLAEKSANGGNLPQSGGSAWASITAPGAGTVWDKTAVEARVDPSQEQSRIGTSISKEVLLSDQSSVTLSNGYNVTQQGVVPVPGIAPHPSRSYETGQTAKLSIGDSGTSVTAGQTLSSTDDKWLRKIGAEQKLLDGLTVSGSVSETAQGTTSKSIGASFRKSW